MRIIHFMIAVCLFACNGSMKHTESPSEPRSSGDTVDLIDRNAEASEADTPGATCGYDNDVSSLGIGLVVAPRRFTLFRDIMLTDPSMRIDLYEEKDWSAICPKFFEPEYGIAQFICIDSTETAYQVLTDFSTVKYIDKTDARFISWSDYIINSFGIRRLTDNGDPTAIHLTLKREPSESSEDIAIPEGLEMFCAMQIRGDWVNVKYDCFYNLEVNPHEGEPCHQFIAQCTDPVTGWLKWKNENKLAIDIFLMP